MKILIADLFSKDRIAELIAKGFDVHYDDKLSGATLKDQVATFSPKVLVVRSTKVTADILGASPNLEAVIRAGSGVDNIDVKAANSLGIFVANCPGKNSVAVAELVWGLILSIDRRIPENVSDLRNRLWNKGEYSTSKGIAGRKIGIIGYGFVGKEVARRALSFGMKVLVFDMFPVVSDHPDVYVVKTQEELLSNSDIVSLHIPFLPSTQGIINSEFLSKMKPDAVLINTSRGEIMNEQQILEHLEKNKEFWLGLDVFHGEPADKLAPFESALALHPRVYGTHHIGASTKQAETAIGEEAYRMILEFHEKGVMPNCINKTRPQGKSQIKISIKFKNHNQTVIPQILTALTNAKAVINETKFEEFEGGNTVLARIVVQESAEIQTLLESSLRDIKEIFDLKFA